MLFNTFNEIPASMMKLSLSSIIPLSAGLKLFHTGTKRGSNAIEKDEKGIYDNYIAIITLRKTKSIFPFITIRNSL